MSEWWLGEIQPQAPSSQCAPSLSIPSSILHTGASYSCVWTPQCARPSFIHMPPTNSLFCTLLGSRNQLEKQAQGGLGIQLRTIWVGNSRGPARREGVCSGKKRPLSLADPTFYRGQARPSEASGWTRPLLSGLRAALLFGFLNFRSSHELFSLPSWQAHWLGTPWSKYCWENKNPLALERYDLFFENVNNTLPEYIV